MNNDQLPEPALVVMKRFLMKGNAMNNQKYKRKQCHIQVMGTAWFIVYMKKRKRWTLREADGFGDKELMNLFDGACRVFNLISWIWNSHLSYDLGGFYDYLILDIN